MPFFVQVFWIRVDLIEFTILYELLHFGPFKFWWHISMNRRYCIHWMSRNSVKKPTFGMHMLCCTVSSSRTLAKCGCLRFNRTDSPRSNIPKCDVNMKQETPKQQRQIYGVAFGLYLDNAYMIKLPWRSEPNRNFLKMECIIIVNIQFSFSYSQHHSPNGITLSIVQRCECETTHAYECVWVNRDKVISSKLCSMNFERTVLLFGVLCFSITAV